jgi:hypothetical protein
MRTHAIWRWATCRIGPARSPQPPAFVRDEHFAPAQRGKRNRAGESFRDPGRRHRAAALPRKDSPGQSSLAPSLWRRRSGQRGSSARDSSAAKGAAPTTSGGLLRATAYGHREPRRPAAAIPAPTRMRVSARPSRETCSSPRVRMRCLLARTGSVLAPGSIERARPALFGLWGGAADGHRVAALTHTGKPDEVGNRPQRLPLSTERGRRGRVCRLLRQGGCRSPQAAQQVGAEVSGGRERAVDRTNRTSVRGDPRRSRHRRPSASARPNVNGIDAQAFRRRRRRRRGPPPNSRTDR